MKTLCSPASPEHINAKKNIIQKDACTPIFIAAPFIIVKTWKQPKCPSTEEWTKKMWYKKEWNKKKKEWNSAICSNMDGPRDDHTKWNQSDRQKQIPYDIIYMWTQRMIQMNLFTNQKQTYRLWKQTYGYQRGKVEGRDKLEVWSYILVYTY